MPEIEKKNRDPKKTYVEDRIIKVGKFRFYFQNYYTILSLINDLLLGGLYFIGSLVTLLDGPERVRKYAYFLGAFFMLMRPLLKIGRNIFIYDQEEYQNKIVDSFNPSVQTEEHEPEDATQDEYGKSNAR